MNGGWARALLALAMLVLVGGLVWVPYRLLGDQAAAQEQVEQHITALEQRISTREQLLAEVRLLERTSPIARLLLPGDTAALAGAGLQGVLTSLVEEAAGVVSQSQVLPTKNAEPFVQVGARVDFTVSMAGLREILHKVESHEPIMLIDRLSLAAERGDNATLGEFVHVSLEIAAFSRQLAE